MQNFEDADRRTRWIFRLLMVLALVVGVAAYRADAQREESPADRDARTAKVRGEDPANPASPARGSIARVPELPAVPVGTLRLEGMVVDEDDRPVGGAHVSLGGQRDTITETDGSFAFDELAQGDYDIAADRGDWFAEVQATTLDDTSDPVTLKLGRGPSLAVKVVDEAGQVLVGAKVHAGARDRSTGPDGIARFRAVDLEEESIVVSMAGHATLRESVETSDDPKVTIEKTVVMHGGAEISGTVVDASGKQVDDAYVELEPQGGGRTQTTWTDASGTFHLPDLGVGTYTAKASSKVHISAASVTVVHDGVHPKRIVLTVEPGGEISGIVVDEAGHPVPEAWVSGGNGFGETSDKDGRFVARGLVPEKYEITATAPLRSNLPQTVQLGRGQHLDVRIVVTLSSLAGIVVDARGEPVEGATVYARSEAADGFGFAFSDEHGRFDLGGLPPSERYKVTAQRDGSSVEGAVVETARNNRALRVVVNDAAMVTGRVLLAGQPVPYFGYAITESVTDTYGRPTPVRDDAGRFTIKDATPGTVAVVIVGPGFARKAIGDVHVVPGKTTDLGDIVVERGETIRGRVVDDRGLGIAGATVRVGSPSSSNGPLLRQLMHGEASATSDANGNYELVGGPPSTEERTVRAVHPSQGASHPATLAEGTSTVDLVLHGTGEIVGKVTANDGKFAVAELLDEPNSRYYSSVEDDGSFTFSRLPHGRYRVDVHASSGFGTTTVEVQVGTTAKVELHALQPSE